MKDLDGRVVPTINGFKEYDNGGKGSGNFGHSGRPGEVGGSGDGRGGSESTSEKTKSSMSEEEARNILDEVADSVMGGMLEDFDASFEKLITPIKEGKLTKKQAEQLMLDGKPEVSSDKKTIYYATRTKLDSASTSEKTLKEDLKYYRDYWKEREENY